MKQVMILNKEIENQLKDLAIHAAKNPFTMDDILDVMNKQAPVAGNYDEFTVLIPVGFRVCFSIEKQNYDVRHLSMSIDREGELPGAVAVEEVMRLLGFKNDLRDVHAVRAEDIGPNRRAINVWEIIE